MRKLRLAVCAALLWCGIHTGVVTAADQVGVWMKFERGFQSARDYDNPLYDVPKFTVHFRSPSGRLKKVGGFWDGGRNWKVRFSPDERGVWIYTTEASDAANVGLHKVSGSFECVAHKSEREIYQRGHIIRPKGSYHLTYADGTPFFWLGDTAWNGPLKSTEEEWKAYLDDRAQKGYNVIQFVATQWRGLASDRSGRVAFDGAAKIKINPEFFQHLDAKVDRINERGFIAAPVLLWALPFSRGKELSPGYYLPDGEAILLAKYIVARYGGHHVVWLLGGDGNFIDDYEQRWKKIGRGVFGEEHPGLAALHSMGRSWIGRHYAGEDWLDIIGYQSGHRSEEANVNWINKGPVAQDWSRLPPRPVINMEPIYENGSNPNAAREVRNASYWSLFSAPVAGVSYGAHEIWPWLSVGENALNHSREGAPGSTISWRDALNYAGGRQVGFIAGFISGFEWWRLRPAPELLVSQPGDTAFNHFVSVVATDDRETILVYVPAKATIKLFNSSVSRYGGRWFDPATNSYGDARVADQNGTLETTSPNESDLVLVLKRVATAGR